MSGPATRLRIRDVLLGQGAISPEQLERALAEQKSTGVMLGEVLVRQGVISGATLVQALSSCLGMRGCQLRHGLIDPSLLKLIGDEEAGRLMAIPMFKVRDTLTVAMAEPQSLPAIDRLRQITRLKIRPVLALRSDIEEFIGKYKGGNVDVNEFLTSLAESDVEVVERETVDDGPMTDLDRMVAGSPIVNLVNVMLLTAVRDKASDIHIEPSRNGTRVRYRIDGLLRDLMKPPAEIGRASCRERV